jgi:hypothetical protein
VQSSLTVSQAFQEGCATQYCTFSQAILEGWCAHSNMLVKIHDSEIFLNEVSLSKRPTRAHACIVYVLVFNFSDGLHAMLFV